jgi:hypothetical protein
VSGLFYGRLYTLIGKSRKLSKIMDPVLRLLAFALGLFNLVVTTSERPFSTVINDGGQLIINNSAIFIGSSNSSASPVIASPSGTIVNHGGQITYERVNPNVIKVQVDTKSTYMVLYLPSAMMTSFTVFGNIPFLSRLEIPTLSSSLKVLGTRKGSTGLMPERLSSLPALAMEFMRTPYIWAHLTSQSKEKLGSSFILAT